MGLYKTEIRGDTRCVPCQKLLEAHEGSAEVWTTRKTTRREDLVRQALDSFNDTKVSTLHPPYLTPKHRQPADLWNVTDWKKVVFSDESRFGLGTDDNRVRVWRRPGERCNSPSLFYVTLPAQLVNGLGGKKFNCDAWNLNDKDPMKTLVSQGQFSRKSICSRLLRHFQTLNKGPRLGIMKTSHRAYMI
ncbi:hypothetical protein TNCV_1431071 [Trichonephila clavipes]|nr:hypothetical protein TNCV_1431071 [Trichonephila clavipes]